MAGHPGEPAIANVTAFAARLQSGYVDEARGDRSSATYIGAPGVVNIQLMS